MLANHDLLGYRKKLRIHRGRATGEEGLYVRKLRGAPVEAHQPRMVEPVVGRVCAAEPDQLDEHLPGETLTSALLIGQSATPEDVGLVCIVNGIEGIEPPLYGEAKLTQRLQRAD